MPTLTNTGLPYYNPLDPASADIWAPGVNAIFVALDKQIIKCDGIALSDEITPLTATVGAASRIIPYDFTITGVYAGLSVASSSGTPTFDINVGGVSILSTKITIDVGELNSSTAAIPPVISTPAYTAFSQLTFDIDVAGTNAAGAKIYLVGILT